LKLSALVLLAATLLGTVAFNPTIASAAESPTNQQNQQRTRKVHKGEHKGNQAKNQNHQKAKEHRQSNQHLNNASGNTQRDRQN
jgi:hypothetical protein